MNKNIKLAILLFMFAISLTILAGQVQALDFDNVKQFKEGKKFEVVIKNSFLGIPTTSVGKVNLVNYSPGCFVDDCYLYYLINNKKNLVMLKGSTTYNRLKTRELTDRTSTYQVWDNTLKSTKSNYKEICDSTYLNGSTKCRLVEKKIITTGGWVNYNVALKQNIGDYYIREKVDIRAGETIDIVPNFYGVSIDEWIDLTGYELIENHSSTANTYDYAYTTRWTAQTFTVGTTGANKDFIIQAINMTFRTGGGSIVWNVSIYGVDGANKPDMSDLLNSTQFTESLPGGYPYHSFVFPNTTVEADGKYSIVLKSDQTGGAAGFGATVAEEYAGGSYWKSTDSGSTWGVSTGIEDGNFEVYGVDVPLNLLDITFISPFSQNLTTSPQSMEFSANATDDTEVVNITLWLNGVANFTQAGSSSTTLEFNESLNLGEGTYEYNFSARDDVNAISYTETQTIIIDATPPTINITSPANATNYLVTSTPHTVGINYTVVDTGSGVGSCWYYNGSGNTSIACNTNISIGFLEGWTHLVLYANDTFGNEGNDKVSFFINTINYTVDYDTTKIEGDNTTLWFNFTATSLTSLAVNLTWNNTIYEVAGFTNSTVGLFNYTLTLPEVTTNLNATFNFTYLVNAATIQSTGDYSQMVYNIPDPVVSADCSPASLNFTVVDEINFTVLNGSTIDYNFAYGPSANNTHNRIFGQLTNVGEFHVCVNNTISPTWYLGEGQIFYSSNGYVDRRYYTFEGTELTNVTTNITLYDLETTEQTSFKLEVQDNSLNPYVEKYTTLVRWYPDLNEYNVVDMGQTDETGSTVIHVKVEDVDYRIGVYEKNGSLIKLADPIRMVCLLTPCTYTLTISPTEIDYTSFLDIEYTFDYNTTTKIWSFVWVDTSQLTSEMNLTVYKVTGTSVYPVCSNSVSGYTGAVTCNTSAFTGTLRGEVQRYASPPIPIITKIIQTTTTAFSSSYGLFLSLLLGLPIIFIFAFVSPVAAVIGGVVALIPAFYFGAISITILGGFAILGGIVLHFLKRIG